MESKEKSAKPKCRGCNKKGEEVFYYWKDGYLWHWTCIMVVAKEIELIKNVYERSNNREKIINH